LSKGQNNINNIQGEIEMTALLIIAAVGGLCFVFGVIYPLIAAMFYPVYRKIGGRKGFKSYMNSI
jgi:hypothetical protein